MELVRSTVATLPRPFLGLPHLRPTPSVNIPSGATNSGGRAFCRCSNGGGKNYSVKDNLKGSRRGRDGVVKVKIKEEGWGYERDFAASEEKKTTVSRRRRRRVDSTVLVSAAMAVEVESVISPQEIVTKPVWNTFASCISGIWKGVGAVFSPLTAEMEPLEIGTQNENLYDCYTFSCLQNSHYSGGHPSRIHRKTKWIALNPNGEITHNSVGNDKNRDKSESTRKKKHFNRSWEWPQFESLDFDSTDVFEEELLGIEPGLVCFEDGSYSNGPLDIPVGDEDYSKYFTCPTFKFEQCLMKGSGRRLRVVHNIEFGEGGSNIQVLRVAVYEEQLARTATPNDRSGAQINLKPFSQRKRAQPSDLTGSWKVLERSATPVFYEDTPEDNSSGLPYIYLCTETLKNRSSPQNQVFSSEEEAALSMDDVAVVWLPGGVTGYFDVKKDGVLSIGVGWYSDEGVNLVMERDYGEDGKLKEVRCKSEVKWNSVVCA